MQLSTELVTAAGKTGIDALNTLAQIQLAALERIAALNFKVGKAVVAATNAAFETYAMAANQIADAAEASTSAPTVPAKRSAKKQAQ